MLGVRSDTPALLAAADAFALTSWSEGMSNTILEAMASGRPVVATRVGGNPELLEEGATGLLVAPDRPDELTRALQLLASDRRQADAMGQRGRLRVEQSFSLPAMISRYTAVYESVSGRAPAKPSRSQRSADKSLLLG